MGATCCGPVNPNKHIVTITSKTVAGEWWGQQVLDIADLHDKDLEFEVMIYHLKLRELASAMDCFLEITIDDMPDYTFRTTESLGATNVHWKTFEKTFRYVCRYEQLQQKFLEIRLHRLQEKKQNVASTIIAMYQVDLYTLAIGPIHQSIELNDRSGKYLGKLSCDVVFSQMNQVEVKLDEVHVKFNEHKDEAYRLNFNIITFQKTFESNYSSTKLPKLGHNGGSAGQKDESSSCFCSWTYNAKNQHLHLKNLEKQLPEVQVVGEEELKVIEDLEKAAFEEGGHPPKLGKQKSRANNTSMREPGVKGSLIDGAAHHAGGSHNNSAFEIEEAPYCTFTLSMDKVRYSSFKFKVWEDHFYKLEKQRQAIHLDDIVLQNANQRKHQSSKLLSGFVSIVDQDENVKNQIESKIRKAGRRDSFDVPRSMSNGAGDEQKTAIVRASLDKQQAKLQQDQQQQQSSKQSMPDATEYYATGHHDKLRKKASGKHHLEEAANEAKGADLIAECYIGFQKLLNDELKAFDLKDSMFFDTIKGCGVSGKKTGSGSHELPAATIHEQKLAVLHKATTAEMASEGGFNHVISTRRMKSFSEHLWFCGQCVGEVSGRLTFYNLPILYQMKVGVLSKRGISFTSKPILRDAINYKGVESPQLKKIVAIKERLISSDTGRVKQRLTLYEKIQAFNELFSLLSQSEKNSMVSFVYSHEQELLEAQRHLIELGLHCLEFAEFVDFDVREYYYQTLCHILRRSELDLGQIGFSTVNQTTIIDKLSRELFQKKVKVAASYQKFQYKAMEMGVEKLNMKGVDVYKRSFVEIIISISYFRVPEFRQKFLNIILEKSDGQIEEWRNTEGFVLDKPEGEDSFVSPAIMRMFDWASYCYYQIPESMQEQSMEILQRALASDKWKLRIQKRGVAFFLIVKQWVIYVKNTLVSNNVSWRDVPGYKSILKAMLLELKERDVTLYPEALKDTTCAMLCNEKLLNVFVTIVFKKTHAFDAPAVSQALEVVASWFTTLHKNKQLIPPQFDYMFFFKAVQMLMDLDHGMSTAKCIWFLYKILHVIPLYQRSNLLDQLLTSNKFYHYFFHWSYNVRMVFLYLYFFQLYQTLAGFGGEVGAKVEAADDKFFNNLMGDGVAASQVINDVAIASPKKGGLELGAVGAKGALNSKIQGQLSRMTDATRTATVSSGGGRGLFFGIDNKAGGAKDNKKGGHAESVDTNNLLGSSAAATGAKSQGQGPVDKIDRLRQLVENKNAQASMRLSKSRLNHCDSNGKRAGMIAEKFEKRKKEVEDLQRLTNKIKQWIKDNKKSLIKEHCEAERKIFQLQVENDDKLKETVLKKASKATIHSQSSSASFNATFLTEHAENAAADDSHFDDIPDERDWRRNLVFLRKKACDFNINNYVEKVLTKEEQDTYKRIIDKIPEENRVYIQYTIRKQYKQIKDAYEKWLEQSAKTEQEVEMPEIVVKVPRDEAETSVAHDEW